MSFYLQMHLCLRGVWWDMINTLEIICTPSEQYKRTAVDVSGCRWSCRKQMDLCVWVALHDGRPSWDPNTETFIFLTHSSVLITQAFWCAESLFPIIYLLAIHLFPFLPPSITPPHIHSIISSTASLWGETDGEPLTLRPEDWT